jgi:hypothetical protein
MTPTETLPARPVTTAVAGVLIVACALTAAFSAVAPSRMRAVTDQMAYELSYAAVLVPFAAGLAVAGLVLAARPRLARPAAVVAAILAAQVAGHGTVAVRDWFNVVGASAGMSRGALATVVSLAAVVALSAVVAGCLSVAVLWREPAGGWRGLRPQRPAYVVIGVAVAVALPPVLAARWNDFGPTMLGQTALTWSLPWGAGLALAGWLDRRARIAASVTVIASILVVAGQLGVAYLRWRASSPD